MMHPIGTILVILLVSLTCAASSLGRVNKTRFTSIDHMNSGSLWLSSYTTWSQCVCTALRSNFSSNVLALNSYANGSCQLFLQLPSSYTMESNNNSTLILFKPLPPVNVAPCCSNLSWLISTINASQQASANVTHPSFLVIDDNDYLATVTYSGPFVQFNRSTMNVVRSNTLVAGATGISYYNGMYYIREYSITQFFYIMSSRRTSRYEKNINCSFSIKLRSSSQCQFCVGYNG